MTDPYEGREPTSAKHFILKRYLQELAFKVLTFQDITYVDGFSGPWQSTTTDFQDSSFMIALNVLQDAQRRHFERTKTRRHIRAFFAEKDPAAFAQLEAAVAPFHAPADRFDVKTYRGRFEDAVSEIVPYIGNSFPLIFIDPTGWTGYPFKTIRPLFANPKCEVLINFMYSFVYRFSNSNDEAIVASLAPILGGEDWRARLDPHLERGPAVAKLFRETLKAAGPFEFVVSTQIDKPTTDWPQFLIAYGTKNLAGLKAFREIEYKALRAHEKNRALAKERQRQVRTSMGDLFSGHQADLQEETIDQIVVAHQALAARHLVNSLSSTQSMTFKQVQAVLMQPYMLRSTNVKDVCVTLASEGTIHNTWGGGTRKPNDGDVIRLKLRT